MLRLTTLGTLQLRDEHGPHSSPLARARIRALLALLARSGETGMARERLCAFLWPESPPDRARHSLEQALHVVRKELGAQATGVSQDPVVLETAVLPSDVAAFSDALAEGRVEEAARLYSGPFLDGFYLSGAPELERWVEAERAALHRQYADALARAAEAAAARGDLDAEAAWRRRLAAAEPYSSRVVLALMRALAQAGDHGGALEAARVHELLLAEELGAAPDPGVAALAAELRREPPGPAPAAKQVDREKLAWATSPKGANVSTIDARVLEEAPAPDSGDVSAASPLPLETAPPLLDATPMTTGSSPPAIPIPRRRRWRVRLLLTAALATLVLAVFSLRDAGRPASLPPAVAVLPFANETGDPRFDPIGLSASDWIAHGLIWTGLVRVAEPGAASPLVAEVSGRVYRSRDTLWLQGRITRPSRAEVAAVLDPVPAPVDDPAAALEPVRKQVLAALGTMFDPRLGAWGETALRPPTFEAYRAFAAALEEFSAMRAETALAGFAEAAALDPDYTQPRLWAAWTNIVLERWSAADSILATLKPAAADLSPLDRAWLERIAARLRGDHERSFHAARHMVEIAPNSGWTIALYNTALDTRRPAFGREVLLGVAPDALGLERLGYWAMLAEADHKLGEHRRELKTVEAGIRAIGRNWHYVMARGRALAALGEEEALEADLAYLVANAPPELVRVRFRVPMVPMELRAHGHGAAARRAFARAIAWHDRPEVRAQPDGARTFATLLYESGDYERADSIVRTLLPDTADPAFARGMLGLLAARHADRTEAKRWSAELSRLNHPYLFGNHTLWRARIAAALGDRDHAIELLRQAAAEGLDRFDYALVHVVTEFDALRSDPAFRRAVGPR